MKVETGKTAPRSSYPEEGIRILKVKNVTGNMINWDEYFYVTEEFYERYKHKFQVQIGDILMLCSAHSKSYIGRCDIINSFPNEVISNDSKCCCVGELIIIRANPEKIMSDYLITFLRLPIVKEQIIRMVKGQSGHLYPKDLKRLEIIIPPTEIQERIAELNTTSHKDYKERIKQAIDSLTNTKEQIKNLILKGKS